MSFHIVICRWWMKKTPPEAAQLICCNAGTHCYFPHSFSSLFEGTQEHFNYFNKMQICFKPNTTVATLEAKVPHNVPSSPYLLIIHPRKLYVYPLGFSLNGEVQKRWRCSMEQNEHVGHNWTWELNYETIWDSGQPNYKTIKQTNHWNFFWGEKKIMIEKGLIVKMSSQNQGNKRCFLQLQYKEWIAKS